jgi:uncharacterized protein YvpB
MTVLISCHILPDYNSWENTEGFTNTETVESFSQEEGTEESSITQGEEIETETDRETNADTETEPEGEASSETETELESAETESTETESAETENTESEGTAETEIQLNFQETEQGETTTTETTDTNSMSASTKKTVKKSTVSLPSGVQLTKVDQNRLKNYVSITWKKSIGAYRYVVYRRTVGGTYRAIKTLSASKCIYKDYNIKSGKKYQYTVRAYKLVAGKKYYSPIKNSKIIFIKKKIVLPKRVTIKQVSQATTSNQVTVLWGKVKRATRYVIYRREKGTTKYKRIGAVSKNKNTYIDKRIIIGKTYYYKVQAWEVVDKKTYKAKRSVAVSVKVRNKTGRSVIANYPCVLQLPQYPSGCEITAMTSVLNYYGYPVSKQTMVNKYLVKQWYFSGGLNFNQAFLGSITSYSSWGGCYEGPVQSAANRYLQNVGSKKRAVIISGASPSKLYEYLDRKIPVVVWGTIWMGGSHLFYAGTSASGEVLRWQSRSHTLVLTGYDKKRGIVYMADPLRGNVTYSMATFEYLYRFCGKRAIILQ